MFHAAAFLHIIPYKTQSAKLFDRPCLLRGILFIQYFDLFANLNIGFTFLRCFAGKEIQNINAVMMRLLAITSKDWGLSDVVPYIELDFFNTSILSSPTVPMIPLGRFFSFYQIFNEKRKIWPVRIGIESERGNKPASRCMRGGENS